MASTIKNLHEISGRPILKERLAQSKNGYVGLGPDDLVVLDKIEKGLLGSSLTVMFYHFVSGLKHTRNMFSAYYSDLIRRQETVARFSPSKRYTISKGRLYSWNSFKEAETRFTIKEPPVCDVKLMQNGTEIDLTENDWYELRLSSELRFYRGSQPLLYALFGNRMEKNYALQTHRIEPMKWTDLVYIVEKHRMSDEVAAALATALLISQDSSRIQNFLTSYSVKIPSIYYHLMRLIRPVCSITDAVIPLAQSHWMMFSDDINLALKLVEYSFSRGDDCSRYTPILKSAMWCNPMAAIVLAKVAVGNRMHERAFNLLNAAHHARNWPSNTAEHLQPMVTKPKIATEYKSIAEARIIGAPFVGANAASFAVTAELIESITPEVFSETFLGKKKKRISAPISSFSVWPPLNFGFQSESADELHLYDPGVESDMKSGMKLIENLPLSQSFRNLIVDVTNALQRKQKILAEEPPVSARQPDNAKEDALSITMLGLRLHSKELIMKAAQRIRENPGESSSLIKLLMLKAELGDFGPGLDSIFAMDVAQLHVSDMNALALVEDLAIAMDQ